jgi:hypothetical protein
LPAIFSHRPRYFLLFSAIVPNIFCFIKTTQQYFSATDPVVCNFSAIGIVPDLSAVSAVSILPAAHISAHSAVAALEVDLNSECSQTL